MDYDTSSDSDYGVVLKTHGQKSQGSMRDRNNDACCFRRYGFSSEHKPEIARHQ
jgi:hypothetical protein